MKTLRVTIVFVMMFLPLHINAQVIGFFENFDSTSGGSLPVNWHGAAVNGMNYGTDNLYADHTTGTGRYAWVSNGYITSMRVTAGWCLLNFWMRILSAPFENIEVGYCTDTSDIAGTFINKLTIYDSTNTWSQYSIFMLMTGWGYITWKCENTSQTHAIDDVSLDPVLNINASPFGQKFFKVYPCPAGQELILTWPSEDSALYTFTLSDIQGRELSVNSSANRESGRNQISMNVEGITNGVYFISIKSNDKIVAVKKVVIAR